MLLIERWWYRRYHFLICSVPDYLCLRPLSPSVAPMGSPEWLLSPLWEAPGVHSSLIPSSLFHLCFLGRTLCCSFFCSSLCFLVRSLSELWAFSLWHVCTHRHTHVNCESSVEEAGFLGQPACCSWGHMACIRAWVLAWKESWVVGCFSGSGQGTWNVVIC